uniref:Uncharacterized protein n=1 Tax=Setaria viridis TaxID=4556 RepID=A0A4U6SU86_SETVI|nr:hypothetical protein SEVIR_9G047333v2 [Setaria viridis]
MCSAAGADGHKARSGDRRQPTGCLGTSNSHRRKQKPPSSARRPTAPAAISTRTLEAPRSPRQPCRRSCRARTPPGRHGRPKRRCRRGPAGLEADARWSSTTLSTRASRHRAPGQE